MKAILPFIVIIISVAVYYVYVSPAYGDIKAIIAEKKQYTDVLQKANELNKKRKDITEQYEAIEPADIERLQKMIPDTANSVDIVTNINAIASAHGMSIRAIKITQPQGQDRLALTQSASTEHFKTVKVAFSVTGPYTEFNRFLLDLESNVRLFDVTMLSLKLKDEKVAQAIFDYSIEVSTYALR